MYCHGGFEFIHELISPVVSERCCLLGAVHYFWLLQSPCLLVSVKVTIVVVNTMTKTTWVGICFFDLSLSIIEEFSTGTQTREAPGGGS